MTIAENPVVPGFYPDPSICRRGGDYYLVTSTFSYAPGVPIFHSKDLAHFEQIGNVLDRKSQLELDGAGVSAGIYAPCIRYYNDMFYMITTNVSGGGNFYVTAKEPEGPWSEPVFLPEAPGIDPSLYFEADKCYYIGMRGIPGEEDGVCQIYLWELDLAKQKLVGEMQILWDGAVKGAKWQEGPDLYKVGDYYYLIISEGGTGYEHSLVTARSKKLIGPYEGYIGNPIFTHRSLSHQYPIQCSGHADLIDTEAGDWYMVMLGTRPVQGASPLGRETFVAEVAFEEEWPVVNGMTGHLTNKQKINLEEYRTVIPDKNLLKLKNDYRIISLRNFPWEVSNYLLEGIELKLLSGTPNRVLPMSYLAVRQQQEEFLLETEFKFVPEPGEEAGILYLQNESYYLKAVKVHSQKGSELKIFVSKGQGEELAHQEVISQPEWEMSLHVKDKMAQITVNGKECGAQISVLELCQQYAEGFVGNSAGLYASTTDTNPDYKTVVFSKWTMVNRK